MARVQLIIPDEDHDLFVHQARLEGMTFSAWLRTAAHMRLEECRRSRAFRSPTRLKEFFRACEDLEGPDREPEWEEHLGAINASRNTNASGS